MSFAGASLTVRDDRRVVALHGLGYHLFHRSEDFLVAGVFSKDIVELVLVFHTVFVDLDDFLALYPLVAFVTSCRLELFSFSHSPDSE